MERKPLDVQRTPFAELADILHGILRQPRTLEDLSEIMVGATPGDDPLMVLDNLLMADDRYGWHGGAFFRHDMVAGDTTYTHRITEADLASGRIPASETLLVVADLVIDSGGFNDGPRADADCDLDLSLLDGTNLAGEVGKETGGGEDEGEDPSTWVQFLQAGDGWLDGCEVDRLCGFRVDEPGEDGRAQVRFVPVVEEPSTKAAGAQSDEVADAFAALTERRSPTTFVHEVLMEVLLRRFNQRHRDITDGSADSDSDAEVADASGAEDEAGSALVLLPLDELFARAGLTQRGDLLAPGDHDWDAADDSAAVERAAQHFQLEPSSHRHLERALDVFDRWTAEGDQALDGVAGNLLPDTFVAEAFGAAVVVYGANEKARTADDNGHHHVGGFASAMVERARTPVEAAPYRWLASVSAAHAGDAVRQVELLEAAHAAVPGDPVIDEDLGYCRFDQSRHDEAHQLLDRAGARGPVAAFVADITALSRADVGRNDPCPCGSGRKYKQCHGSGRGSVSAADSAAALYYKPQRLLMTDRLSGPNWMVWPGRWADEETSGPQWRAGIEALDELGVLVDILLAEGGGMDRFLQARRAVLPSDEIAVAERWVGAERGLFTVRYTEATGGVVLDPVAAGSEGESLDCTGDLALLRLNPGTHVVARPLPVGAGLHRLFGALVTVPESQLDEIAAVFNDPERDAESTAKALVGLLHDADRQSDETILCFAVVEPGDTDSVATWMNQHVRFDPTPNQPLTIGALEDGTIVIDNDGRLTFITYSEDNHVATLDRLGDTLGAHEVLAEHAVTAAALQQEVMMLNRELVDGAPVAGADPSGDFDSALLTRILETALALNIRAG